MHKWSGCCKNGPIAVYNLSGKLISQQTYLADTHSIPPGRVVWQREGRVEGGGEVICYIYI